MQARIRRLSQAIAENLKGDRKRRVETAGKEVETLFGADPPNPREAWSPKEVRTKATCEGAKDE